MYPRRGSEDHSQSANQYPATTHGHGQRGHSIPKSSRVKNARCVCVYLSRPSEGSSPSAFSMSSVKQNKQERSRNPGGAGSRSGESGRAGSESRARRSVLECGAVSKSGEVSTSLPLSLPPQPGSCRPSTITGEGIRSSGPRSRRTSSRDALRRGDS